MPKPTDYTGQRFGKLTALKFTGKYYDGNTKQRKRIWEFKCDCGVICEKVVEKVVKGWTRSCGCLKGRPDNSIEALQNVVYADGKYNEADITFEQFVELSQKPCFYCGAMLSSTRKHRYNKSITWSYNGLDRLDSSKKHTLANCVPCCPTCNTWKRQMPVIDFLTLARKIADNLPNKILELQQRGLFDQYVSGTE